uniref:Uncharacterized protein n=1 Tax=Oryza sativa subsp. japonica TaxID=39947 RepID=Q8RUY5_ORYSJ|nr:Hypothetical protein [Oryza sativa Japonica Group]AAM10759.1 Hypothetical protein [Oryza sativa Japonica Group]
MDKSCRVTYGLNSAASFSVKQTPIQAMMIGIGFTLPLPYTGRLHHHVVGDAQAPIPESKVVDKLLRVVPEHLSHIACSMKTLLDIDTLSLYEVTGRLHDDKEHKGRS